MTSLGDIANALAGTPPKQGDVGTLNKKGLDARPFPKQYHPQLNDEAAAQQKKATAIPVVPDGYGR